MRGFHLYAMCSTMYGSARASFRAHDMDALPGTKLLTIACAGVYGPALLPIYLINDLNRAYIYKNDLKYSDYGYPDKDLTFADILFK